MPGITDLHGRTLSDLRISVTDRCNFRCGYCMPRDKVDSRGFLPRQALLSFEEVTRVARQFVGLGVRKLRLTGGEPLLRRELYRLVEQLAPLGAELALTTNGARLAEQARDLRAAGLHRVTVSLDALSEDGFQRAVDAPGFSVSDVLRGIEAAQVARFERLKVNCVVRRGVNEDQVLLLARHFSGTNVELRFIEFMDVGTRNRWDMAQVVSKEEILQRLAPLGPHTNVPRDQKSDVAERFAFAGLDVGIIASVTAPFCGSCSRARLSADGHLYTCLFAQSGSDLRQILRTTTDDAPLFLRIKEVWQGRRDRYSEERSLVGSGQDEASPLGRRLPVVPEGSRVEMSYIGG